MLADGSVVSRLAGLTKDNAGYDLPELLVGSEGTLGVITRVRWKLAPLLSSRVAALVPLQTAQQAAQLLATLRANAPSLESCDFFLDEGLELVLEHQQRESPVKDRSPFYVLAECAAQSDPTPELAVALEQAGVEDALVADDTASRRGLWTLREGHTDAINAAGVPHKLDVGVPLRELDRFIDEVPGAVRRVGGERVILFGHLGDGNVHVNVLGADPDDHAVDDAVLELALECGGTISAEHGVGVAKAAWLERARGSCRLQRDARDQACARSAQPAGKPRRGADELAPAQARAVNVHGIRLMPWMNALRSSSGSPASMSGITRISSLNVALICVRASDAPMQKCGPPPPKPRWRFGRRETSNSHGTLEHLVVAVARVVEEHDLLACRDLLTVQLHLAGGGAAKRHHRRRPADELLNRVGHPAVDVFEQ